MALWMCGKMKLTLTDTKVHNSALILSSHKTLSCFAVRSVGVFLNMNQRGKEGGYDYGARV